jgi:hypothetical protein
VVTARSKTPWRTARYFIRIVAQPVAAEAFPTLEEAMTAGRQRAEGQRVSLWDHTASETDSAAPIRLAVSFRPKTNL